MTDDQTTMTLVEHLEELRRRLLVIVICVLGAAVLGFFLSRTVLALLRDRLPADHRELIFLAPADALTAQLKIAGFHYVTLNRLLDTWRWERDKQPATEDISSLVHTEVTPR